MYIVARKCEQTVHPQQSHMCFGIAGLILPKYQLWLQTCALKRPCF